MEEEAIQVEPQWEENHREYKHDMQRVAHSDSIIEYRTIWNTNIRIKICQHVIKGGFSKEKEGKEACSNVDSRAEG